MSTKHGQQPDRMAVVISTYNSPDFLRLTLDGYRQQTDHHFTIYIADDGSNETTATMIRELQVDFPVPIHHIWQVDQGFRKARIHNEVIRRISEPYTLLTDGDCIPLPGLIAAHRKCASPDALISGSRILLSENWTAQLCSNAGFVTTRNLLWWLSQCLQGHINRLLPLLLPTALSSPNSQLEGIRGCHLSCYTDALHRVNGFDEAYEGWGREDSDLTARLLHMGLKRCNLRGTPVLHLWHAENSRSSLDDNDVTLQACLHEKRIEALCGLRQLNRTEEKETDG